MAVHSNKKAIPKIQNLAKEVQKITQDKSQKQGFQCTRGPEGW